MSGKICPLPFALCFLPLALCPFKSRYFHLHCSHAFFASFGLKRNAIAIPDFIYQAGHVHKNFLAGALFNDETITFGLVVKFNGSLVH
jgi:hypothetical protein